MVQRHQKWYSGLSKTQIHKYKYTSTQIHKYSILERVRNTLCILIFLKSQWSKDIKNDILDCQIHKYTNTKTQMHKYTVTKCRKYPTCVYFQKARDPRTSKMIFWTVKNTNTHEMRLLRITKSETMNHWPLTDFCTVPPGLLYSNVFQMSQVSIDAHN